MDHWIHGSAGVVDQIVALYPEQRDPEVVSVTPCPHTFPDPAPSILSQYRAGSLGPYRNDAVSLVFVQTYRYLYHTGIMYGKNN